MALRPTSSGHSLRDFFRSITVEPVLFFYMFSYMFTSVVEQAFYVDKACRVNLNLSDYICSNIEQAEHKEQMKEVQVVVSSFHQYNGIVSNVVPLVLALFIGAWSDRRGRKLPLLLGLAGTIYNMAMLCVVALQDTWPLEIVLAIASFPSALTGTNLVIFASTFSYMADVTSTSDRTLRIAILDGSYLASMPTGIALGSYFFHNVVNKSFAAMFGINVAIMFVTLIYSLIRLDWLTTQTQQSMRGVNCCSDFFEWKHVVTSVRAVIRRRSGHRRLYLFLLILSMGLYTFQRNERSMSFLYTQQKFQWDFVQFSNFRTFQTSVYVIVTLLGAPVLTKLFGLKDSLIVLLGAPAHAIARVIFAFAQVPWLFYLGKIFAILAMADSAVPLVSAVIYSQVFNATINTYPAAFYWVTVATQTLVFVFILFVHISLNNSQLEEDAPRLNVEDSD